MFVCAQTHLIWMLRHNKHGCTSELLTQPVLTGRGQNVGHSITASICNSLTCMWMLPHMCVFIFLPQSSFRVKVLLIDHSDGQFAGIPRYSSPSHPKVDSPRGPQKYLQDSLPRQPRVLLIITDPSPDVQDRECLSAEPWPLTRRRWLPFGHQPLPLFNNIIHISSSSSLTPNSTYSSYIFFSSYTGYHLDSIFRAVYIVMFCTFDNIKLYSSTLSFLLVPSSSCAVFNSN